MNKIKVVVFSILFCINLYANEENSNNTGKIDKLDALDKQSQEFFNAITGLEKDYLEEQVNQIKSKKTNVNNQINSNGQINQQNLSMTPVVTPENYEKGIFTHQNEMAKLTTDFTKTKKLKDIKIKSMYSFNGKDYVVLKLDDETMMSGNKNSLKDELSANIEGRYVEGDNILGHKIVNINTRTKSIELYKQLDEENGYSLYLSNYGISVSDLKKSSKKEDKKSSENGKKEDKKDKIKDVFSQVSTKDSTKEKTNSKNECLYSVKVSGLNVRNDKDDNAKILRVLKKDDQFSVKERDNNWIQIDKIYKKVSGDIMDVSSKNNWVLSTGNNLETLNNSCK